MAKKGNRQILTMQCSVCKSKNYVSTRNTINTKDKLAIEKFCAKCRKNSPHQEIKV
ncbi:MAG: 50S ribosomal protein L33 [Candidatus Daviesbacteria bacterium]|nr:50S ribosomal protein L33 [Candidatus Daviesbacteria bacterium]